MAAAPDSVSKCVNEVVNKDVSREKDLSEEKYDGGVVGFNEISKRAELGLPPLEPPTPHATRAHTHEKSKEQQESGRPREVDEWLRGELGEALQGRLFPSSDGREGGKESKSDSESSEKEVDEGSTSGGSSRDEEGKEEVSNICSYKRTGRKRMGREYLVEWKEKTPSGVRHSYTWEPARSVRHLPIFSSFTEQMENGKAHETTAQLERRHEQWPAGGVFEEGHSLVREIMGGRADRPSGSNVGESSVTLEPEMHKEREVEQGRREDKADAAAEAPEVVRGEEGEKEGRKEIDEEIKRAIINRIRILKIIVKGGRKVPETRAEAQRETTAWPKWLKAEETELSSFSKLKVWKLVPRPVGKNVIKVRWVYDYKLDANLEIIRHKARLVAKGFSQKEGIDYNETFAPTMHIKTMRLLLALAAHDGVEAYQYDVSTAFLHASLKEETYVEQPPGHINPEYPDYVYKLDKAMYGLKNAPRAWSDHLMSILGGLGYKQSTKDDCLWSKWSGKKYAHLLFHVDDMLCVSNDNAFRKECFQELKQHLDENLKDEGVVSMFLGVNVSRLPCGGYSLDQKHYIERLAERFNITADAKRVDHPHEYGKPGELGKEQLPQTLEEKRQAANLPFQELVGGLLYATKTRVDIQYPVSDVSRFMSEWGKAHWKAAVRILRYLYVTRDRALLITKSKSPTLQLTCYVDANYGDERQSPGRDDKWKSQGGYLIFVGGSLVSWSSRRHRSRTFSSMESEYMEASEASKEVVWMRAILEELGHGQDAATVMHEDNKACIAFSKNNTCHDRTKHIDIRAYALRDRVREGMVVLRHIETKDQLADMMTKTQLTRTFIAHRDILMDGLNTTDFKPESVCKRSISTCLCVSCWLAEWGFESQHHRVKECGTGRPLH